jgi:hypothetical protein
MRKARDQRIYRWWEMRDGDVLPRVEKPGGRIWNVVSYPDLRFRSPFRYVRGSTQHPRVRS